MFTMNDKAIEAVHLFIAELLGYKRGTKQGKIEYGMEAVRTRKMTDSIEENIWLDRLYNEMTALLLHKHIKGSYEGFHWSVPIELDASASMLSYVGALLGDRRLLTMCNAAGDPEVLDDPWHLDGLSRNHVKKVATPRLYGSSTSAPELWKKAHLAYDNDMVQLINKELKSGPLGLADRFKEFIINNCNPRPEMRIVLWNDEFNIQCNHYKRIGEVTVAYDLYDTESGAIRRVNHTKTKSVPDLEHFKLYFATLLIHGLDSQVADKVAKKVMAEYDWCIDVHDAFIVHPVAAEDCRLWYAEAMTELYENRTDILNYFFASIGIPAAAITQWKALMELVDPVENDWVCRTEVLK
jgi:hypothetical protein